MDQRQIEELLPFYALEALTEEERELVEAYLTGHPEARQQLEEMGNAVSVLPHSVQPVEPASDIKKKLMARVESEQRVSSSAQNQPSRPHLMRLENFFQALSLGAAAFAIIWGVVLTTQLNQLQNKVSLLGDALVAQSNSLQQINSKLAQPTASPVMTISLKGTSVQPQAQGQLIADLKKDTAVLVIAGLARLEAGKTYQVWLINGNALVSAGLLSVDANGQGVLIVSSRTAIGSFNSLGISIEPDGGSKQPTGDIVVLSDL